MIEWQPDTMDLPIRGAADSLKPSMKPKPNELLQPRRSPLDELLRELESENTKIKDKGKAR